MTLKIYYNTVLTHKPPKVDYSKFFKNKKNNIYIKSNFCVAAAVDAISKNMTTSDAAGAASSAGHTIDDESSYDESELPPLFLPFTEKYVKKYDLRKLIKTLYSKNEPIPKIIYQTWVTKQLPPRMAAVVENMKRKNPDFEHKLFDDDDCREFISKHFGESVVRAFDSLIPGAFRADLWRYCVLFITGGVYIDIKFEPLAACNLSEMIEREHFCLGLRDEANLRIYNAFMICRPKNPLIYDAIYRIVDNVRRGYYGKITLQITGPMLLGEMFKREAANGNDYYMKSISLSIALDPISKQRNVANIVWIATKRRIFREYDEYRDEQREFNLTQHYNMLYEKRMIFRTNDVAIHNAAVPTHVYQTWFTKKLAPGMKECFDVLREQNPEFTFHLFDDAECRDFIAQNFDDSVVRAFDALVPGAYKADLWRYCVLFIRGGIYLDCKYVGCYDFKFAKYVDKEYFVLDNNDKDIYNAFMVCRPGNPILRECIQKIVEYVAEEYYGENPLYITGPVLLRQIYCKYYSLDKLVLKHRVKDMQAAAVAAAASGEKPSKEGGNFTRAIIEDRTTGEQLMGVYPNYRFEQKHFQNKEHYDVFWRARTVYNVAAAAAETEEEDSS